MRISIELSFIQINARGMVNKLVYIEFLLKSITNDFDILAVSEKWENYLNSNIINISGYTNTRVTRETSRYQRRKNCLI